ncbi:MAG: TraI domain-containing protein [Clostridiales bacterium]|nr:TraI domain-containing protein [Clostridiales bacterium]
MDGAEIKKLSQLTKGETAIVFCLVRSMNIKTSTNNKSYGDYTLCDASGEMNAKLWDVSDEDACPKVGDVIKVKGLVTEWQNNLQLRMDKFRPVSDEDEVDLSQMIPSAPYPPEEMLATIKEYLAKIKDDSIRKLTVEVLREYAEYLPLHPAALHNHHAIRSGLLYHTTTMLKAADALHTVYPDLDYDLVYAGVIMHDICKTVEINAENAGIATEYSRDGLLLGHIVQGIIAIEKAGEKVGCDQEKIAMIQHMLLSHHYEPEFGSPRRPMFPEAELVHYLDMIDTRMYDMDKALGDVEEGKFSPSIWTLHKRRLYKKTF